MMPTIHISLSCMTPRVVLKVGVSWLVAGYHENLAVRLSQKYDVAFDVAQHLVRNYGTRAPWRKARICRNVCIAR